MKKIKTLLVAFSLLIGASSVYAGRQDNGWMVTTTTGNAATIFTGRGYVRAVAISSGAVASIGDYVVFYTTIPVPSINGAEAGLFGGALFASTAQVIPALVYRTTTTIAASGETLNNFWRAGDCETCYIEIGGSGQVEAAGGGGGGQTGRATGGLFLRQSAASSGEAHKVSVYWSR